MPTKSSINLKQKELIQDWFNKWEKGDFLNLPLTDNFTHTSPFGTIKGKQKYLNLVNANKDKFLGHQFEVHDKLYNTEHACVRYTTKQNDGFSLDVSEWFYFKDDLIDAIVSYYHIGEIREERQLSNG